MFLRSWLVGLLLLLPWANPLVGQTPTNRGGQPVWRSSDTRPIGSSGSTSGNIQSQTSGSLGSEGRHLARVTAGSGTLPNQHGQQWREYDISPYTLRVTSTSRPEQSVVDWILRETGYEAWHMEPLGVLTAAPRKLLVYHTPQMQDLVAGVVDRFVNPAAETHRFGLRVVTVNHPNWRAKAYRFLEPVQVQTAGVHAWLLQKENAAILLAELQRRADYREHNSPQLLVAHGQSAVVSATRTRTYIHDIRPQPGARPGYKLETNMLDEGYSLELNPLLSVDGRSIDAMIRCNIDQVEKMLPVSIDIPTASAPRQRAQIEVPQMVQFRFHERFRWPVDRVLLVELGLVAAPVPSEGKPLVPGIPLPFPTSPARADVLVFVDSKGNATAASAPVARHSGAAVRGPSTTNR